jgi:hypothetical protein
MTSQRKWGKSNWCHITNPLSSPIANVLYQQFTYTRLLNIVQFCTENIFDHSLFHIHSFDIFHTDLQSNTIVTCILTSQNHIWTNMQDCLLQLMQMIQYRDLKLFSMVITNNFIGEVVRLKYYSLGCLKTIGFVLT